jgi:hypothetical protein
VRFRKTSFVLFIVVILLAGGSGCQTPIATKSLTEAPTTPVVSPLNPVTQPAIQQSTIPSPTPTLKPSILLKPANFVLGDLTVTPAAVMIGEQVTWSIPVSNTGGTEGSYTLVFNYKNSGGVASPEIVTVTLKPGETRAVTRTTTHDFEGTVFINVNNKSIQYTVTRVPTPIYAVPATSASAITSPPPSMAGINTHKEVFSTGANPELITLGPKLGSHPEYPAYATKHSIGVELKRGTPLLAPIDMVLIGFNDSTAEYRIQNGQKNTPYYDLELVFESASPDWPGMIIKAYHLLSSPLVIGHNQNPDGTDVEEWGSVSQSNGHLYGPFDDAINPPKGTPGACQALLGYKVKRGELIGFAGGVGPHTFADFCFKVSDTTENPTVQKGNRYLHWVQPDVFFYWKAYSPDASFPSGVLAYPFECDGYQLPVEQHDVNFKYSTSK